MGAVGRARELPSSRSLLLTTSYGVQDIVHRISHIEYRISSVGPVHPAAAQRTWTGLLSEQ